MLSSKSIQGQGQIAPEKPRRHVEQEQEPIEQKLYNRKNNLTWATESQTLGPCSVAANGPILMGLSAKCSRG